MDPITKDEITEALEALRNARSWARSQRATATEEQQADDDAEVYEAQLRYEALLAGYRRTR